MAAGHRKRVVLGLLVVLGCLLGVAGASAWSDLRPARAEVLAAQAQLQKVVDPSSFTTSEQRATNRAAIASAEAQLASARRRIGHSPVLWAAQFVPFLRRQRAGLFDLVDDARRGSATAVALIDRVQSLPDRGQLREGAIPLDSLPLISTETGRAARVFEKMQRSPAGLWGPLGSARRRLDEVAGTAATNLGQASDALGASHGFFGGDGDRRYLLAIENNAEMRDQGDILSYGVLHLTGGRFQFERRGSIAELGLKEPAPTPIPPGTQEVFGAIRPTALWQSVNATADFEWSGRAMVDMYHQATGQTIDGVLAIDVPGLAELLRVVGPVSVTGVDESVSADNVARILLHDLYEGLGPTDSQSGRRERLDDVVGAIIDRLSSGDRDLLGLGAALGRASGGGHLRLWSAVAAEEQSFVRTGLGGGPAAKDADRTFHLAVENRTATKLDYYVKPTVRQDVRLDKDGTAVVTTTVVVDNQAPAGAPPSYALGPDEFTKEPGDYLAWVLLWGPAGANQPGATSESGLNLSQYVTTVAAGQKRELSFTTTIPRAVRDGRLTLRLVPQARLEPMPLEVHLTAPGWQVEGAAADWKGPWDKVERLSWKVSR
ncbi:MAG: DUF4012 domain-containing protein [Actinomycetota bacterium]|nr:DUF4012 domain-containing protein [Actinomycetota bacterium]